MNTKELLEIARDFAKDFGAKNDLPEIEAAIAEQNDGSADVIDSEIEVAPRGQMGALVRSLFVRCIVRHDKNTGVVAAEISLQYDHRSGSNGHTDHYRIAYENDGMSPHPKYLDYIERRALNTLMAQQRAIRKALEE